MRLCRVPDRAVLTTGLATHPLPADSGSDYRARTALMSDGMIEVAPLGFTAAAAAIRAAGVHILMEMQLHTRGACAQGRESLRAWLLH